MDMLETARRYVKSGLCVLPARAIKKCPDVPTWKPYQTRLPYEAEVDRWFSKAEAICVVCGSVSGNLEMLDFDLGGEAFEAWHQAVAAADPQLLARLVIEQSPSGGWHVVYRSQAAVSGNMKLAQRLGPDGKVVTLIEIRGEGGLFLCAPTAGYEAARRCCASWPKPRKARPPWPSSRAARR